MKLDAWLQGVWRRWQNQRLAPASTVRLDHRRIFILPSRAGMFFLAALLVMLLAAINYQNSLAYGLTFLLGSVSVVAILHTWRNVGGLKLQTWPQESVFASQTALFGVRVEAGLRARYAVALGWSKQPLQLLDVAVAETALLQLPLLAAQRGWLRAPRLRIESRYPLGLWVAWSWVDLQQQLLVYPQPLEGDLPIVVGSASDEPEPIGERPHSRGVDDFQGLRSYQPGDSKRRLDWKAFSRGQGLLVKDFSEQVGGEMELLLEALPGDLEYRLSVLCHWVLKLSEHDQPFALNLGAQHLPSDTGIQHRDACLRALALYGMPA